MQRRRPTSLHWLLEEPRLLGEPGCPVAERTARANGAELTSCVVHTTEKGLSVTVEGGVKLHRGWELPVMPTTVVKSSRAGPVE